jgi:hypothetical protein
MALVGRNSSVTIATGRSGDRIPVGARFSAPIQTGPGAHSASYMRGTGSFPRVKRPRCGADYPPTSSAEVKERVEPYLWALMTDYMLNSTLNDGVQCQQYGLPECDAV